MDNVEAVARALCILDGGDPDGAIRCPPCQMFLWETYVGRARVLKGQLRDAGLAILPTEPTRKMYDAYVNALPKPINGNMQKCSRRQKCKLRWQAMVEEALKARQHG